jgi:hypothetical protein
MDIFVATPRGVMMCQFDEELVDEFIADHPDGIYFFADIVPA